MGRHCKYVPEAETARGFTGVRPPVVTPNHIREPSRELLPPGTVSMEISGRGGDCHTERTVGEITEKTETGTIILWSLMKRFMRLVVETHILLTEKGEAVEGGESTDPLTITKRKEM